MRLILIALGCFLFSVNVQAVAGISAECEKQVIKAVIKVKESHRFLEFSVEGVTRSDLFHDFIQVQGRYSDAEQDYTYMETYEVAVVKNSCEIVSAQVVDVTEM